MTPDGTPYTGFEIKISDGFPPAKQDYTRETVREILNTAPVKVHQISNTHIIVET